MGANASLAGGIPAVEHDGEGADLGAAGTTALSQPATPPPLVFLIPPMGVCLSFGMRRVPAASPPRCAKELQAFGLKSSSMKLTETA